MCFRNMLGKSSPTLTNTLGLEKGTKKTKTTYGSICKSSWNNFCNLNCIIFFKSVLRRNFQIHVLCQRNKAPTSCSQYSKTKNTLPACLACFFLDPRASRNLQQDPPNRPLRGGCPSYLPASQLVRYWPMFPKKASMVGWHPWKLTAT